MIELTSTEKEDKSNSIPDFNKLSIAPAFKEELKIPKPVQQKRTHIIFKWPGIIKTTT